MTGGVVVQMHDVKRAEACGRLESLGHVEDVEYSLPCTSKDKLHPVGGLGGLLLLAERVLLAIGLFVGGTDCTNKCSGNR